VITQVWVQTTALTGTSLKFTKFHQLHFLRLPFGISCACVQTGSSSLGTNNRAEWYSKAVEALYFKFPRVEHA
jgi:hypothetical protein